MAIEGRLRDLALSEVFQLLDLSGQTGTLTVQADGGDRRAVLWFERGSITGVEACDRGSRLGSLLLRSGAIDEAGLSRVIEVQREDPALSVGAVLLQLGVVTEKCVERHLRLQVENTVFDVLRWEDGTFRFEEDRRRADDGVALRVSIGSLLVDAARRHDERIAGAETSGAELVPVLSLDAASDGPVELDPAEWELLAQVDGERNLRQIREHLGRSDQDLARSLTRLRDAGLVTLIGTEPVACPSEPDRVLEAMLEADRLLERRLAADAWAVLEPVLGAAEDRAGVLLTAGRVLLALGRVRDAFARLSDAVRLDPLAAEAHLQLGTAAYRSGDLARAENAWSTFSRLADDTDVRADHVGRALRAATSLRDAVAMLDT